MTNFDKIKSLIDLEIVSELLNNNALPGSWFCGKCEEETEDRFCEDCECPFVNTPKLMTEYLKENAKGFNFNKFFEKHGFQGS